MLADTTYQVYCSNLRKYRKKVKETEGLPDQKYWEEQALRMEARILVGGRTLPPEEKERNTIIPNGVEMPELVVLPKEVGIYTNGYKHALAAGDLVAAERFKQKLLELGYEVKDEGGSEPNGNGNAA